MGGAGGGGEGGSTRLDGLRVGSGLPHTQLSRQRPEGTGALPQNQFLEVAPNGSGNPRSELQDGGCEGHPHAPPPEGAPGPACDWQGPSPPSSWWLQLPCSSPSGH